MRGRCLIAAANSSRALSRLLPAWSMRSTLPSLVHFSTLKKLRWSAISGSFVSSSDQFDVGNENSRACAGPLPVAAPSRNQPPTAAPPGELVHAGASAPSQPSGSPKIHRRPRRRGSIGLLSGGQREGSGPSRASYPPLIPTHS